MFLPLGCVTYTPCLAELRPHHLATSDDLSGVSTLPYHVTAGVVVVAWWSGLSDCNAHAVLGLVQCRMSYRRFSVCFKS